MQEPEAAAPAAEVVEVPDTSLELDTEIDTEAAPVAEETEQAETGPESDTDDSEVPEETVEPEAVIPPAADMVSKREYNKLCQKHDGMKLDVFNLRESRRELKAALDTVKAESQQRVEALEAQILDMKTQAMFDLERVPESDRKDLLQLPTIEQRQHWARKLSTIARTMSPFGGARVMTAGEGPPKPNLALIDDIPTQAHRPKRRGSK